MGKDIPRNSDQQPKCSEGVDCVACNMGLRIGIGHGGRHDVKRHKERAAHIANAQSRLGNINSIVCDYPVVLNIDAACAPVPL